MVSNRQPVRRRKVFIVDDHPIVRKALTLLIAQEGDLVTCGEAETASGALRGIEESEPDIAIIDISLKDTSGVQLIKDLRPAHSGLRILVLSMHEDTLYVERALRAGARGYVVKEEATDKVIMAIRRVLAGEIYLGEKLASKMLSRMIGGQVGHGGGFTADILSDREMEVFELIGRGAATRQIAEKLHRSVKTIESHRANIKRKLKLKNASELLQHAVQWAKCADTG